MDGTRPRLANQKEVKALFQGTGLDPRDKIRNRVVRRARKHLRRRSERSSSSDSGSESKRSSSEDGETAEESIFETASKVRVIAEHFPGALTAQAMSQMRSTLLQEVGLEDRPNTLHPVAVAYLRQNLQKRASGPTLRELLTLSHYLDSLVRGKVASATDVITQRIKSIEQSLSGSHWSVSQRLEVLPPDSVMLTAVPEAAAAQKELYAESKARYYSGFPDGRAGKGNKGQRRGKGEGKDKPGQNVDRDRKGSKGSGGKADPNKKKD